MTNALQSGAVQTAVQNDPDIAFNGMPADGEVQDKITRIATGTAIPFGAYVVIVGETCALPAAAADITGKMGGIALADAGKATGLGYLVDEPVTILRRGRVWVTSENAMAELDNPFIRYTVNGVNPPGGISHVTDAAKNVQASIGVEVVKGNTAAGFCMLQLLNPGGPN